MAESFKGLQYTAFAVSNSIQYIDRLLVLILCAFSYDDRRSYGPVFHPKIELRVKKIQCFGLFYNSSRRLAAATCSHWFLARGFFYPKDGGDNFLPNVGSHKIYTAPNPRRRHSS
jgi:hypothetical protein